MECRPLWLLQAITFASLEGLQSVEFSHYGSVTIRHELTLAFLS